MSDSSEAEEGISLYLLWPKFKSVEGTKEIASEGRPKVLEDMF
jgi:hypothetical protein